MKFPKIPKEVEIEIGLVRKTTGKLYVLKKGYVRQAGNIHNRLSGTLVSQLVLLPSDYYYDKIPVVFDLKYYKNNRAFFFGSI